MKLCIIHLDDIRALSATQQILKHILKIMRVFSVNKEDPNRDFICQCATILRFCSQRDELFKIILNGVDTNNDGVDLVKVIVDILYVLLFDIVDLFKI
jgi:hypothetical protein